MTAGAALGPMPEQGATAAIRFDPEAALVLPAGRWRVSTRSPHRSSCCPFVVIVVFWRDGGHGAAPSPVIPASAAFLA